MLVNIVVAKSKNNVIGIDNRLPWHISSDLKNFKQITMGKPIIMGRKTFTSIGKPLPGRLNIVLTSNKNKLHEGIEQYSSFKQAILELTKRDYSECMIIGGASLYEAALPIVDFLYLTEVDCIIDGDTYFPAIDLDRFTEISRTSHIKDSKNDHDYSFVVLKKK